MEPGFNLGLTPRAVIFARWFPCLSHVDAANHLFQGPEPSSAESTVYPAMHPSLNPFSEDSMQAMPLLSITIHSCQWLPCARHSSLVLVPEEGKVQEQTATTWGWESR